MTSPFEPDILTEDEANHLADLIEQADYVNKKIAEYKDKIRNAMESNNLTGLIVKNRIQAKLSRDSYTRVLDVERIEQEFVDEALEDYWVDKHRKGSLRIKVL